MQNKNEKTVGKSTQKTLILGRFWEGFWEGLGRFGGYKNKIGKKIKIRGMGHRVPIVALGRYLY